jgi:hypothetical protein
MKINIPFDFKPNFAILLQRDKGTYLIVAAFDSGQQARASLEQMKAMYPTLTYVLWETSNDSD